MATNSTLPYDDVHLVIVNGREDGIHVFTTEYDAKRYADTVNTAGGDADIMLCPLNATQADTDHLIAAEQESWT